MSERKELTGMNRREFLRIGLAGTTSALLGGNALAETVQLYTASESEPFAFPKPVYRTLGRTGMKITVVSFGAMLTPEPEVIKIAFDQGINYVDTARRYMGGKNEEIVGKALKGRRDRVYVATKTPDVSKSKEDIIRDNDCRFAVNSQNSFDVLKEV